MPLEADRHPLAYVQRARARKAGSAVQWIEVGEVMRGKSGGEQTKGTVRVCSWRGNAVLRLQVYGRSVVRSREYWCNG